MILTKKKLCVAILFATVCTAGYYGYNAIQESPMTDVMKANVDALSDDEYTANCTFNEVKSNQEKNELTCKGKGTLCCVMPQASNN
jgi:hypothetical protein